MQRSVLMIAPQPFFVQRGTPLNVRAAATALAKAGYQVDLLVFPYGAEISMPGVILRRSMRIPGITNVPIGPSWTKIALDILLFFSALRIVIRKRYDAIHGIEEGGFISLMLGRLFGIPCIFDMDSCMVSQLESSGFLRTRIALRCVSFLENLCMRNSTAVVTVCQALSEKVRLAAPNTRVHQIEDFPMDGLDGGSPETIATVQSFVKKDSPVILYTGNFEVYQGIDLLVDSFAEALKNPRFNAAGPTLLMVGGDDIAIARLAAHAESLGIRQHIVFTGPRPGSEMGAFMRRADVLVSPRLLGSNTPLKLYSYMASGKPIVATRIQSHTQVLDDESAILAEPRPDTFGAALAASIDPGAEAVASRERRVARALHLVETRYSRERFDTQFRELYHELIGPALVEVPKS